MSHGRYLYLPWGNESLSILATEIETWLKLRGRVFV